MRTFTPVMLATLGQCARRFQIEYVDDYRLKERRRDPWPPNVKVLLRDALRERDWTQWRSSNWIRTKAILEALMATYAEEWREARGRVPPSEAAESDAEIDSIIVEAKAILNHYYEVLGSEPLKFLAAPNGKPALDYIMECPLPGGETAYAERLDGIVKTKEAIPSVLIRRFVSSASPDEVRRELAFDLQLRGTMWTASQLMGGFMTTALVDVVRRKAPSDPETIQCRVCSGTGEVNRGDNASTAFETCEACHGSGIGGMSKKSTDTTMDTWLRKVNKAGLDLATEMERCKDVVARLQNRGETFCYRLTMEVTQQELEFWVLDAVNLIKVAEYYASQKYWPRNPAACIGRSGPCPYRKVCNYHGDADMAWFAKVDEQYPGLD